MVVISASCQHVEFFEAAGISKFDCSREILLSSLTTISFVVILALETSIHSGVSEQVRRLANNVWIHAYNIFHHGPHVCAYTYAHTSSLMSDV